MNQKTLIGKINENYIDLRRDAQMRVKRAETALSEAQENLDRVEGTRKLIDPLFNILINE